MTTYWEDGIIKRPDRYFDWDAQNDQNTDQGPTGSAARRDKWCSVLIQMKGETGEGLLANLYLLWKTVSHGNGADQPRLGGRISISMNADEQDHLANVIGGLQDLLSKPGSGSDASMIDCDSVRYQFFVYLPESSAYSRAQYASYEAFRIRYVGPSIEQFRLDPLIPVTVRTHSHAPAADQLERAAIGIIDESVAFANERFRFRPDPKNAGSDITRISQIWLQDIERAAPDKSVVFGSRYGSDEINQFFHHCRGPFGMIDETKVYQESGQTGSSIGANKSVMHRIAHSTHIMDLACGYDLNDPKGLERPIFAVQLPSKVTADTSGSGTLGSGKGSYVLQAVRQIMLWADTAEPTPLPLVLNINHGITPGSEDGTFYLDREIDRLIKERNKRVPTRLVLPAVSTDYSKTTVKMDLPDQLPRQINWMISPDKKTFSFLEIWLEPGLYDTVVAPIKVVLTPPNVSPTLLAMPENGKMKILKVKGETVCGVYYDVIKLSGGRQRPRIFIAVNAKLASQGDDAAATSGRWSVVFVNQTKTAINLNAYIQRDDNLADYRRPGRQSYFDHKPGYECNLDNGSYDDLDPGCTITQDSVPSSICNGSSPVINEAAHCGAPNSSSDFAQGGSGSPTAGSIMSTNPEDGPVSPGMLAAGTLSGSVVTLSGTSVAAPQVTRLLADLQLDIDSLIQNYGTPVLKDPRLGFGSRSGHYTRHSQAKKD